MDSKGNKYIGQYESNIENGVGEFKMADKSTYKGELKDGCFHGFGIYENAKTKSRIFGEW